MNTPNPLIPQGSLEAQQYHKRSATKIVVSSILAVHGVVLGGLLFLGCDREPDTRTADATATSTNASGFESLDAPYTGSRNPPGSSPFEDLGITNNSPITIPQPDALAADTNLGDTFPPMPPGATGGGSNAIPPETKIPVETEATKPATYAVLPGDSFSTIARKHNVTLKQITAANPTVDSRKLKVGQVLKLPANVTPVPPAIPQESPTSGTSDERTHTVKSGDTLTKLARDYKVSVKDIQRANNLRGSVIRVGQKLVIPAGSTAAPAQ